MLKEQPSRKVGLVTFTDKVEIIGDGSINSVVLQGNGPLNDYDFIKKSGVACAANQMEKPLKDSHVLLKKKVKEMRPQGSTALGPGLLAAIGLAGEGKPGSQVIVCTDGAANMGLGNTNNSYNQ